MDNNDISPISALAVVSGSHSVNEVSKLLMSVPHSARWIGGRMDRPWGLGDDFLPKKARPARDLETILMGKESWFFRADGKRSYDTLREAFVGERLNGGRECGCVSAYAFGTAAIDCEAQLEFMREVLRRILLEMPHIDLRTLQSDLFVGQRQLCEHYLWWLENEAFVAHPSGQEQQDRLMLTDEGCSVLAMLEMTKPGSNRDMSARAMDAMRKHDGTLADREEPRFLKSV